MNKTIKLQLECRKVITLNFDNDGIMHKFIKF